MENVIKVFTSRSLATMLAEGGSGYWILNEDRASACQYVVAVRNIRDRVIAEAIAHRTAFMIGKISEILQTGERHLVAFSEIADLSLPNSWTGSGNPVAYTNLFELNIQPATLQWSTIRDRLRLGQPQISN